MNNLELAQIFYKRCKNMRKNTSELDLIKMKNSYSSKDTVNTNEKQQATNWDNVSTKYI